MLPLDAASFLNIIYLKLHAVCIFCVFVQNAVDEYVGFFCAVDFRNINIFINDNSRSRQWEIIELRDGGNQDNSV